LIPDNTISLNIKFNHTITIIPHHARSQKSLRALGMHLRSYTKHQHSKDTYHHIATHIKPMPLSLYMFEGLGEMASKETNNEIQKWLMQHIFGLDCIPNIWH
jgi:hypothetical protein